MATALKEKEAVLAAANLLRSMGASEVFVFGSLVRGELRPDSISPCPDCRLKSIFRRSAEPLTF